MSAKPNTDGALSHDVALAVRELRRLARLFYADARKLSPGSHLAEAIRLNAQEANRRARELASGVRR